MTSVLQSQHSLKSKKVWKGRKPKPSSKSVIKAIAKAKGKGK